MSLDKAIKYGKEKRKEYKGAKSIDKTWRNHGSCEWCSGNRKYSNNKKLDHTNYLLKLYKDGDEDE